MADLSKIKLNGVVYNFKDSEARNDIENLPIPTLLSELYNDEGYIKSYTETDPIFLESVAATITNSDITNWNNKLSSAPVTSVNGSTGAVIIDKLKTTAGVNNTEYNLIGTATTNNNTSAVSVYNPTSLSFAKTDSLGRLTIGSSSLPGVIRLYSDITNATGYTELKSGTASTNTRTITFPDASGTVALTTDIPNVSSWALAANKPTYTAAEVGATTETQVSGMISTAVANITSFQTSVVASLPATGTSGTFYFVSNSGSGDNIYDEYLWINNTWEKIGTLNTGSTDLSGYLKTTDIADWAKAAIKPSYTASEVGALASNTTYVSTFNGQSGAITYIPPVTSVNGQTGAVTVTVYDDTSLAARVTALENTNWNRYYTGTSAPSNSQGQNGDLYFQTGE